MIRGPDKREVFVGSGGFRIIKWWSEVSMSSADGISPRDREHVTDQATEAKRESAIAAVVA